MTPAAAAPDRRAKDFMPELRLGLENLRVHALRTLLTMLGMIFGVAAVVAMLSIGAGAQQEVIAFIEQLGVRNVIVEAREASDNQALQRVRKLSAGLSFQDLRAIESSVDRVTAASGRKRIVPMKVLPKPQGDMPTVYGVGPAYQSIAGLRLGRGRFFTAEESEAAAPVAVLGQGVAASLFGTEDPVGRYVKANQQWYRVIGVAGPEAVVQTDVAGLPAQDRNHIIYVPLMSAVLRLEDALSWQKDEIDGIYLQFEPAANITAAGALVRGLLDAAHRGAGTSA